MSVSFTPRAFRRSHWLLAPPRSIWAIGLITGMVWLTGCGKSAKPAAETPAPAPEIVRQAANDHMPNYQPPARVAPAAATAAVAPSGEPDLGELNRSLLRWMMQHRRRPNSFEDFAASAGVAIPPAPSGKKYIIGKDMRIQLVKS